MFIRLHNLKGEFMDTERIYFDNASTTNLGAEVLNAMMPVLTDNYGNSSSGGI